LAYKVIVPDGAKKQLAKLDKPAQKRIVQFLVALGEADNPRLHGIAMQGNSRLWRYRVGDYRLIADIDDGVITITITKIGHRREVYR
jgi:mRNA interferase RelE/StbE